MTAKSRSSPPESAGELKGRALRLLARREHSRAELARKLAPHAGSGEAVETLLAALEAGRQVSDERFAEARAYQLSRKYGAERVRRDLLARGVAPDVAARLAADSRSGDVERAHAILARKYRSPATTTKERARRIRFLQSRGFSLDVIRSAVAGAASGESP